MPLPAAQKRSDYAAAASIRPNMARLQVPEASADQAATSPETPHSSPWRENPAFVAPGIGTGNSCKAEKGSGREQSGAPAALQPWTVDPTAVVVSEESARGAQPAVAQQQPQGQGAQPAAGEEVALPPASRGDTPSPPLRPQSSPKQSPKRRLLNGLHRLRSGRQVWVAHVTPRTFAHTHIRVPHL